MKKINFRPLTKNAGLIANHPTPASKSLPDWFKNIDPYIDGSKKLSWPMMKGMPNLTIKRCVPVLDAMTAGYMVSLTDDLFVEQTEDGPMLRWRHSDTLITNHSVDQFQGFNIPDNYYYFVWKWHNDWSITLPEGYSMYFTHPSNRFDLPFRSLSGVVDCDSYDSAVHFPFLIEKGFEGIIKAGTPICQLIPFKREKWQTKVLEHDEDQSYLIQKKFFKTFAASYKKNYWHKKEYN